MNLLLVSIDSLRVDFVARTNPQIRTPRFDEVIRDFAFSDRCFSVSSATRPVHTTLFTGLYPFEHGVLGQRTPRMRSSVPHLFEKLARVGYRVEGFSQAAQIFSGLAYAPWIRPFESEEVQRALRAPGPRCVFLHFWETHTPYGAADGRALGETAALLAQGNRAEVVSRYCRAVVKVFEGHLAPLLTGLPLERWLVLICGDHGESWTAAEPYHGQSLENSVLRVPFFLHVPYTGAPRLETPILSLVDVFPTVLRALGVQADTGGFGRDLRLPDAEPLYLAELDPGAKGSPDSAAIANTAGEGPRNRQWAIFDAQCKFTCWEDLGEYRLEHTFSGEALPLSAGEVAGYCRRYHELRARSPYNAPQHPSWTPEAEVDRRLRDLGYL